MNGEEEDLNAIERRMTRILNRIRQKSSKKIIETKDGESLLCICGKTMVNKQKTRRKIVGLSVYEIKRRSFYCSNCKEYHYPLDQKINIQGRYSLEVEKAILLLGQRIPFEESSDYLEKLMDIEVSHKTIQTKVESVGKKVSEVERRQVRRLVSSEGRIKNWEETAEKERGIAYLQMDVSMVQTREESWKEVRNGMLFADSERSQIDKHHKTITNKRYFSISNQRKDSLQSFKDRTTQEAYAFKFNNYE